MQEKPRSEREQAAGREWFNRYCDKLKHISIVRPKVAEKYPCPCCGYRTLSERGGDEICKVCFWEDDGQDDQDADDVRGGPNGSLSLTAARKNFAQNGVVELRFKSNVRPPTPDEVKGRVIR